MYNYIYLHFWKTLTEENISSRVYPHPTHQRQRKTNCSEHKRNHSSINPTSQCSKCIDRLHWNSRPDYGVTGESRARSAVQFLRIHLTVGCRRKVRNRRPWEITRGRSRTETAIEFCPVVCIRRRNNLPGCNNLTFSIGIAFLLEVCAVLRASEPILFCSDHSLHFRKRYARF